MSEGAGNSDLPFNTCCGTYCHSCFCMNCLLFCGISSRICSYLELANNRLYQLECHFIYNCICTKWCLVTYVVIIIVMQLWYSCSKQHALFRNYYNCYSIVYSVCYSRSHYLCYLWCYYNKYYCHCLRNDHITWQELISMVFCCYCCCFISFVAFY